MPSNKGHFVIAAKRVLEQATNGKGTTFSRAVRPHKIFRLQPLRFCCAGRTSA